MKIPDLIRYCACVVSLSGLLIAQGCIQGPDGKPGKDGKGAPRDSIVIDLKGLWLYHNLHNPNSFLQERQIDGSDTIDSKRGFGLSEKAKAEYAAWDSTYVKWDSIATITDGGDKAFMRDVFIRLPHEPAGWEVIARIEGRHICGTYANPPADWIAVFSESEILRSGTVITLKDTKNYCLSASDGSPVALLKADPLVYYPGKGMLLPVTLWPGRGFLYSGSLKIYYW